MNGGNHVEKQTILVVDDSPDDLALITSILKDQYKIKVATSGRKALQLAFSSEPLDLILLDIMMPEMDGYEVCRELKGEPHTYDIPVIFLTARSDVDSEIKGFDLGAVDYITKPISPPIVLARIRTHLKLKRMTEYLKSKLERKDLW